MALKIGVFALSRAPKRARATAARYRARSALPRLRLPLPLGTSSGGPSEGPAGRLAASALTGPRDLPRAPRLLSQRKERNGKERPQKRLKNSQFLTPFLSQRKERNGLKRGSKCDHFLTKKRIILIPFLRQSKISNGLKTCAFFVHFLGT